MTFTPNVVTAGSGWQLRMDYDDGAGYSSYVPSPASGLLSRSFYMAGDYSVGAFLTDTEKKLPVRKLNYYYNGLKSLKYMSHVTRKPVFGVWDQLRFRPACSVDESS